MFGAVGRATEKCVTFVSGAALDDAEFRRLGLRRRVEAVRATRELRKSDMIHNGAQPRIEVDSETYDVRADGELLTCQPATSLPMAQRYFLF
jgi:urease subunit alpha